MNPKPLRAALLAAFLLIVASALYAVRDNERVLAEGRVVLVQLAPVDPRSLMQGDYMALRYAIDNELLRNEGEGRYAHLALDAEGRASLVGLGDRVPDDPALVAMELRSRDGRETVGPNAFFFQEGHADDFSGAQWGEFRVDASGKALLTHLRGEDLLRLGENRR
ncbi:GDYXXLXY domain-containing protein [Aromatoleum toluclasticum]|uniref:GDYXXLXY domain-containing protein n=1 Tax=Aromatoleum toluclasticum TaxID=92003 RepID=UPI00037C36FD|nr:GDYXXLXY domain-containing protein [Aromatoleum toluclasticum]MCC4114333.1 GDYXXLXY domain-containing protein [Aromatoleum toluclasticum]